MTLPGVAIAGRAQQAAVMGVVTLAFATDPVTRVIWPDPGDYLAHMPAFVVGPALAAGRLVSIFRDSGHARRSGATMKVYYPPAKHRLPKVKAFVDFLLKQLRPVSGLPA